MPLDHRVIQRTAVAGDNEFAFYLNYSEEAKLVMVALENLTKNIMAVNVRIQVMKGDRLGRPLMSGSGVGCMQWEGSRIVKSPNYLYVNFYQCDAGDKLQINWEIEH